MRKKKTYAEIAASYESWCERADPEGTMTEADYEAMTSTERIAFLVEAFGPEEENDEDNW